MILNMYLLNGDIPLNGGLGQPSVLDEIEWTLNSAA